MYAAVSEEKCVPIGKSAFAAGSKKIGENSKKNRNQTGGGGSGRTNFPANH